MIEAVIILVILAPAIVYGAAQYLAAGGGPRRGLAPGADIQMALSAQAHRRKASSTRPSTTVTPSTPVTDVAIPICRTGFRKVHASMEEVVLVFAKPRMGKTALLANHVIDAPGSVVATSTKADIYTLTAPARRLRGRPVYVFNPDNLGDILSTLRWSPVSGCHEASAAMMRAGYLISGSEKSKGSSERDFWNSNAHRALHCLLMAAALDGGNMHDIVAWAQNLADKEPIRTLKRHPKAPNGWADMLERIGKLPDRTQQSISVTLASALAFMADPALAHAATPGQGETTFDAEKFVREQGTLYLLGKQREYGAVGPLFAALAGDLFETAQTVATHRKGGRLDPPMLAVLDEAALICKLPLERLTADCGGRGIPLVISVQGPDQLYDVWGEQAGATVWSNAGMKVAFGGLDRSKHLDELVKACGDRIERRVSRTYSDSGVSRSISMERVPVMRPEDIRELRDFRVLVLYRNLGPIVGTVRPVWKRRDVRRAGAAETGQRPPTTPLAPIIWLADYARRRNQRKAS